MSKDYYVSRIIDICHTDRWGYRLREVADADADCSIELEYFETAHDGTFKVVGTMGIHGEGLRLLGETLCKMADDMGVPKGES